MATSTFINGRVFTGRCESHGASAFRVRDGVFDWVGDADDLDRRERAEAVDLGGARVLPGLLDVHTHPGITATLAGATMVLPPAVSSIEALVTAMSGHRDVGVAGAWILGFGYDESSYPEARKPNRHDLDRISTTQPVLVRRCDAHSAVCNTAALRIASITAATPDPIGGHFGREADGTPDGLLTEPPAVEAVDVLRPRPSQDDLAQGIADLEPHYLSQGLVGVCDLLSTVVPDPIQTFRLAADKGFRLRCGLYYGWREALTDLPQGFPADARNGRLYAAGLKLFGDGAFSDRTAWCARPYPGTDDVGIGLLTTHDLVTAARWARAGGVQLAVHAMGDRAIEQVVDVLGDLDPWVAGAPSVRIDHATLIDEALMHRLESARMRFGIVSHTIFYFAEYGSYDRALGPDQRGEAYPIRRYYASAVPTALASDAPATAWSEADHVFTSIQAAVTRRAHNGADIGQGQAITLAQALLLYTSRAAEVAGFDGLGRIDPGYEGSFVVLDRDPFELPAEQLADVQIAQTWLRGELVFER